MRKLNFFFVLLLVLGQAFSQNSLISSDTWTEGTGSVPGFNQIGSDLENNRLFGTDPYGNQTLLWQVNPDTDISYPYDGGWWSTGGYTNIDNTKTYRFSIWVKKTNVISGSTSFGFWAINPQNNYDILNLNNEQRGSGTYFFTGNLPHPNDWYLLVGFIHKKNHSGTTIEGAIYDAATGFKVSSMNYEYKFNENTDRITQWAYLKYDPDDENELYFWNPEIYDNDDPLTPTVEQLLAPAMSAAGNGQGKWTGNSNGIHYTDGNVGIGTADAGSWKLAVNGNIRAKEIKVETGWADYVFKNDYDLPSLEEVEKHIAEKGHLINIPSAADVEVNGVLLGEMNKLLLEKIEELTLYILEQNKIQKKLDERIKSLETKQ